MGQTVRKALRIPDKNSSSDETELSEEDFGDIEISPFSRPVADVDYARKTLGIPDKNSRSDEIELAEEDLGDIEISPFSQPVEDVDYARKTLRILDKNSRSDEIKLAEEDLGDIEISPFSQPVADEDYARKTLRFRDKNSRSDETELSEEDLEISPFSRLVADVDYARKTLKIPDKNSRFDEIELAEEDLEISPFSRLVADVDYTRKTLRIPDKNSRFDEIELAEEDLEISPFSRLVADVDYARKTLRIPDKNSRSYEIELAEEDLDQIGVSSFSPPVAAAIYAELFSATDSSKFLAANFFSSSLEKGSMWISGSVGMRKNVLWNVQVPDFKILLEKTRKDIKTGLQIMVVSSGKRILFAEKSGSKIYRLNTQTHAFETMFHDVSIQIDAMCCNDDHMYIFQKKSPDVIQILDSKFQSVGKIPTGFKENISKCEVDLCTTTMKMSASIQEPSSSEFKTKYQHMCIISTSNQYKSRKMLGARPSVRAVNESGVIWKVGSKNCPEFDENFNPCSVSSSTTGDVFIADNGSNKVSKLTVMTELLVVKN